MTDTDDGRGEDTPESRWANAVEVIRMQHPDWSDEMIAAGLEWAVKEDQHQTNVWVAAAEQVQAEHPDWSPEQVAAALVWAVTDWAQKNLQP